MADLRGLLASITELELEPVFREEELNLPLLLSIAPALLRDNLLELGLSDVQVCKVAAALDACRGFEQRVRELQADYFADDLIPPAEARSWSPRRLRSYFELGGVDAGPSSPPPVLPTAAAEHSVGPATTPGCATPVDASSVVGSVAVRWRGSDYVYSYGQASRVADLKAWLQARTRVAPCRQKLGGWSSRHARDTDLLREILLSGAKLMLIGTPDDALEAAELELERARRTGRYLKNDLNERGSLGRPAAPASSSRAASRTDRRPIRAERGGGIFLDPEVWAPPVENARGGGDFVLNPASERLERLALSNALLRRPPGALAGLGGDGGDGRRAPAAGGAQRAPINVDHMGMVRGRCTSCPQCTGFERQDAPASENDLTGFCCARCGCEGAAHELLGVHDGSM